MEAWLVWIIVGIVAIAIWWGNILSRQTREIGELRQQLRQSQGWINWLIHQVQQLQSGPITTVAGQPATAGQPPAEEPAAGTEAAAAVVPVDPTGAGWRCPACSRANLQVSQYCNQCGAARPARAAAAVPEPVPQPPAPRRSLFTQEITVDWWGEFEQLAGTRWMTWVGVLILIAAAGFTVKYLYDMGWLQPWARVGLEALLGLLIIFLGRYALRHGMRALGQGFIGLGLAVFYVTIYAGYAFHHLVPPSLTLALVAMVTGAGLVIALRYDALAILVLAILGGLATPELVSLGADIANVLFAYTLVLDLGVLAVAVVKRWRMLDLVTFLGTIYLFASWVHRYYTPGQLTPTVIWLGVFYLLFLLVPFAFSVRTRQPLAIEQFIAAIATALVMITASAYFLSPHNLPVLGVISLLMALCYLTLAVLFRLRQPDDERAHNGMLVLALVFVTLTVPLLLKLQAVLLAWVVEAPVLTWLGYRFANRLVRFWGVLVLLIAAARLLFFDWSANPAPVYLLFANVRFGSVMLVPLGAAALALVHHWIGTAATEDDRRLKVFSAVSGGMLALGLINLELHSWFASRLDLSQAGRDYLQYTAQLLALLVGAALFMLAGLLWQSAAARYWSLALFCIMFIMGLAAYLDAPYAGEDTGQYWLFLNFRFGVALVAVLVMFALAMLHSARAAQLPAGEQRLPLWLAIATGWLALLLFAGEVGAWFAPDYYYASVESITALNWQALVWAIGAVAFLAAGIRWRSSAARLAGLGPLALGMIAASTGYLSHFDATLLSPTPDRLMLNLRFGSSLAVVLALLAYGLFLRRARANTSATEQSVATAGYLLADLGLLALLSLEVYRYFAAHGSPGTQSSGWAQVSLSIVWGVYALAFILIGFWLEKRVLRLAALGLFGLTALKLLVVDFSELLPAYRLLSSVVLGLLMIATSYLYHRVEQRFKPEENEVADLPHE